VFIIARQKDETKQTFKPIVIYLRIVKNIQKWQSVTVPVHFTSYFTFIYISKPKILILEKRKVHVIYKLQCAFA